MLPTASGDRVGLIVGNSLDLATQLQELAPGAERRDLQVPAGPEGDRATTVTVVDGGAALILARHGIDHYRPAHVVDHHANVRALCRAGADRVLALASCGTLRTELPVGSTMWPDDFLAPWVAPSFHGDASGHSIPGFDLSWRAQIMGLWAEAARTVVPDAPEPVDGGVYAQTTGPRFETPAEVRMLAHFADVVGMTLVGEAVLAREAGLRYAAVCTVDNLANGLDTGPLTIEDFERGVQVTRRRVAAVLTELLTRLEAHQ